MSFLQPANAASLHAERGDDTKATSRPRVVRKAASNASFLAPLASLARYPTRPLESIWNAFKGIETTEAAPGDDEETGARRQALYLRMKEAENHEDWRSAACELDVLEGNEAWKQELECAEYDVQLVQASLKQLDEARISCDVGKMLFIVRTSLTRGLGGMGQLRLYKHSHIGTKKLIEQYIQSAQETVQALLDLSDKNTAADPRYILDQLLEARQAFGRSALLLSGGGTFGMNHVGVVRCLWQASLLPRIISGSSAGSIVCAVLCAKTDDEIPEILDEFCYGDMAVFGQPGEEGGLMDKIARFLKVGSIFDIAHLIRVMRGLLGDMTFQEAYNRTRRILNISVSSESIHELPRLLNYITAPNVVIWSAVAASCSVPLVFTPAQLLAKDPKTHAFVDWNPSPQKWIDGSVDNDLPMTRLAEMFNVNHFIVSQVNPHVVPFLTKEEEITSRAAARSTQTEAAGPGWMHTITNLARSEALHRMQVLAECGVFPNYFTKAQSILSQKYSGDITILPEISYANFPRILTNPDTPFMLAAMLSGERATWPKLSRIQNHCAIELTLDQAVQRLRSRIVFSPSQVDLRLSAIGSRSQDRNSSSRRRRAGQSDRRNHAHTRSAIDADQLPSKRPRSLFNGSHKHSPEQPERYNTQHLFVTTADMLSSSADDVEGDPRLFSEDTDQGESWSSDTDDITSMPGKPDLWPSTRQLFPSNSQPTTPFFSSRLANSTGSLAMTPRLVSVTAPSESFRLPGEPSTPELRYKQLFHGANPSSRPSSGGILEVDMGLLDDDSLHRGRRASQPSVLQHEEQGGKTKRRSKPLRLDISGTRGMLMRMKRSMSTGVKGLQPPGRQ